ncbi:MAG: hypothetical protein QNJ36_01925 [Calothrix sp. MO_167.B42]|nr:hypothetical protein [Calothrix sp. MO_167.B42]
MSTPNVITSVSVMIAALSFVSGVSAWKREFIGKRRIELAESVLAMFYEVEDVIREIRNPFSHNDEGKSRKRSDNEREEESKLLDRAYIVFERYQKREKLFAELRSMKYRFRAAFVTQTDKLFEELDPFEELDKVLQDIWISASMLGSYYWQRQGREVSDTELKKHLSEMHKYEAVFWLIDENEDTISLRIRNVVQQVENITRDVVKANSGLSWQQWPMKLLCKSK